MVKRAISSINRQSACGHDKIPIKFWYSTINSISPFFVFLFNRFLEENYIPLDLKYIDIIPIYKRKGLKQCANSYRPISLANSIFKILEFCILEKLKPYIEPKLSPNQYGYQANRSTLSNLLDTYETLRQNLNV